MASLEAWVLWRLCALGPPFLWMGLNFLAAFRDAAAAGWSKFRGLKGPFPKQACSLQRITALWIQRA